MFRTLTSSATQKTTMLSEYDKELLTAFVDGELTRASASPFCVSCTSLRKRSFLRDLQEDVHLFKVLPQHKLEEDFAATVLGEIATRRLKPQAPAAPKQRRRPLWFALATAAALLIAVGVWLTRPDREGGMSGTASLVPEPPRKVVLAFRDIAKPETREEIRKELAPGSSVHLDLAVRNERLALEKLVQVFKANKVELITDSRAKKSKQYVVYAQGLRPDELASMLHQLGVVSKAKKEAQAGFESVTLTSLDQYQRRLSVEERQRNDGLKKAGPSPGRFVAILANAPGEGERLDPNVLAFLADQRETHPDATQILVTFSDAGATI
ncbi:MAG: hypothetical protein U0793_28315 [Gemmataceae bacterium]